MQNNFDPKGFIKFINQLKIGIDLNTKSEKYGRKYEKIPHRIRYLYKTVYAKVLKISGYN